MRLRSGRTLAKMVNPKNTSRFRNDALDPKPTITLMVGTVGTSNLVEVTCSILTPVATSTSIPRVILSLPSIINIPITHMPTLIVVRGPNPPYVPSFTIPLVTRDYPYGRPTAMMLELQSHILKFADNVVTIESPLNS